MVKEISAHEAKKLLQDKNIVVIDVRSLEEWEEQHLPKAILVSNEDDFKEKILPLDKEKQYVLFCRSGHRSHYVAEMMEDLGFEKVVNVKGDVFG
ncbi:MAG TPA: rhodanese-like domain-containing protein [Candidatus Nanoarchaeia archaeon]|nr:rhodanese-like domain-containing protein [Candidatus Nanoarchaeia archaeon]